ncbi:MAG: hypothetical protein DRJ40_02175 [Thermoprotei archaeon]|nr:MAG: hypothetical protein DRJ40_02175 [Thermoprotei archaeon]
MIPRVRVHGVELPKVLVGTSPMIAAGQFSDRAHDYYLKFVLSKVNRVKFFKYCLERGLTGIQLIAYSFLAESLYEAMKDVGTETIIVGTLVPDDPDSFSWLLKLGADIVLLHAITVDTSPVETLMTYRDMIKEQGMVFGIATHTPHRTLTKLIRHLRELDVAIIMTPLNRLGTFLDAPLPQVEALYNKIFSEYRVPIIAKKALAAGKLSPETALPYVLSKNFVASVAVGLGSEQEVDNLVDFCRRYFHST